jgi:hypothetical protein
LGGQGSPELNWHYLEGPPLDIVVIFWLPAVELNIFAVCDQLAVLPVVVSFDIQRAGGSPFENVYHQVQKLFSMSPHCS